MTAEKDVQEGKGVGGRGVIRALLYEQNSSCSNFELEVITPLEMILYFITWGRHVPMVMVPISKNTDEC